MKKRIVSIILTLSMVIVVFIAPVHATNSVDGIGYDSMLDAESGSFWVQRYNNRFNMFQRVVELLGLVEDEGFFEGISGANLPEKYLNWLVSSVGFGEVEESVALASCRNLTQRLNNGVPANLTTKLQYNNQIRVIIQRFDEVSQDVATLLGYSRFYVSLRYDDSRGVYRPYENTSGHWVTDSFGRFICYKPAYGSNLDSYADSWVHSAAFDTYLMNGQRQFHMTTKAALEAMANQLGGGAFLYHWREYWVIADKFKANSSGYPIRCDYNGNAYACWYDDNSVAVNKPQTITEVTNPDDGGDVPTITENNNQLNLDLTSFIVNLPDGDFVVGDAYYDYSNKSYTFNAYTYNITNNYYTYNISYSWTYHVNYTSVTYIGQSEEYDKTYEFYYQLPDGRSSADLTAEELEQLNLSVDVINYGRSADDTRLRSLYHFDGNTDDSSYWNYATSFQWNKGASLTYMESGNFNGALYLDETEHDFSLTLPSALGTYDFTLQFRIYQSYTEVPQLDSYIKNGNYMLLQFNGSQILNGSGTVLASMPVGSWNEIALIRDNGVLRYYLNGVQLGTVSDSNPYSKTLVFHFGSAQQTYKELD